MASTAGIASVRKCSEQVCNFCSGYFQKYLHNLPEHYPFACVEPITYTMALVNPNIQLEELANGAPYPITKEGLIGYARQQNFDENLITVLQHLPDGTYNACPDVIEALTKSGNKG